MVEMTDCVIKGKTKSEVGKNNLCESRVEIIR
jgi:hypothetical protein